MSDFGMPPVSAGFPVRGAFVIQKLMDDFGLQDFQAAGIVGNLGGESGLTAIQERHPIAGRGGFGWAQWTGPRRVAFEQFCASQDISTTDDEANYRFLIQELQGDEKAAVEAVLATKTLDAAALAFVLKFERPADPYGTLPSRIRFGQKALAAMNKLSDMTDASDAQDGEDPDNSADDLNRKELAQITGRPSAKPGDGASDTGADATDGGSTPVKAGHVAMGVTGATGALGVALAYHLGLPDAVAQADAVLLIFAIGALHVSGVPSAIVAKIIGGSK